MARQKQTHKYTFADCEKELPSVVVVTCSITGHTKKFHHAYLAKMIAKKFDNDYSKFESGYVSNEGKPQLPKKIKVKKNKKAAYVPGEVDKKPEGYRQYLIVSYQSALSKGDRETMNKCAENYLNRYEAPITSVI